MVDSLLNLALIIIAIAASLRARPQHTCDHCKHDRDSVLAREQQPPLSLPAAPAAQQEAEERLPSYNIAVWYREWGRGTSRARESLVRTPPPTYSAHEFGSLDGESALNDEKEWMNISERSTVNASEREHVERRAEEREAAILEKELPVFSRSAGSR